MNDEEERKQPHRNPVDEEVRSKAFHFVIKRQEMTADFDERQKQLFDQALIAILVANLIPDKLEQALAAARDTTISVFSGEMLADLRAASKPEQGNNVQKLPNTPTSNLNRSEPADSPRPVLHCANCHGYNLNLGGKVVQCDDCGTIQPALPCKARPTSFKKAEETLELLRQRAQKLQTHDPTPLRTSSTPEFGPYPRRPNLTAAEAEAWWESKTPMERYIALGGGLVGDPELTEDNIPAAVVVLGAIGAHSAAISPYWEWKNIPERNRTIVLDCMQKGWIDMGNTAIGYAQ